jgi:hypothetical protein
MAIMSVTGRPGHRALYAAIVQGEENAARHRLDRLAGGVNLIDLCERVIARRCAGSATIGLPGGDLSPRSTGPARSAND